MADASRAQSLRLTAQAAFDTGKVFQAPDGRAAVVDLELAIANGERFQPTFFGPYTVTKTTGQEWIDGGPIWWDYTNSKATAIPPLVTGGRSFFLGAAIGDAASADEEGTVNLNVRPAYEIDFLEDGGDTAIVKTAGSPTLIQRGGSLEAVLDSAAEAQKLDWLSKRSFDLNAPWVLEAVVEVQTNAGAATVVDLDMGVASGTHASDFEAITEFAAFHFDLGDNLNLYAHSDDNVTDVAPTDTTVDWAVGTPIHLVIDGRTKSSLRYYANMVRVLSGTTFTLAAAAGPLKLLAMLEKSANAATAVVQFDRLRMRYAKQRG